jgi:hypothetical protein
MDILKKLLKSRTIILAVVQAVVGILLVVMSEQPELFTTGGGLFIKSIIDMYLRLDTDKSVV